MAKVDLSKVEMKQVKVDRNEVIEQPKEKAKNKKFTIQVGDKKPQEIEAMSLEEARRIALDFNNITVVEVERR